MCATLETEAVGSVAEHMLCIPAATPGTQGRGRGKKNPSAAASKLVGPILHYFDEKNILC